jgi:hypothetical protein
MALRRLSDHPALAPLVTRRQALVERLRALEDAHQRLTAERSALEQQEAQAVAVMGSAWSPTAYRQLKERLSDNESEAATIAAGLELLDQEIDAVTSMVRDELEAALNWRRKRLIDPVIAALETLVDGNRQIHALEALSQRLLQVAKYHLYDAGLEPRLALLKRSQHLLALAELGSDDTA